MKKIYESVGVKTIPKSAFDLSHEVKMSGKMGNLMPIYTQECLPADEFSGKSEVMLRLAPTLAPIMHRVDVFIHYFFVPNRILWDNWEKFIFPEKSDSTMPAMPVMQPTQAQYAKGTLWDYLGLPTETSVSSGPVVSQLPFRAYLAIYNDYYRDENLEDEIALDSAANLWDIRQRAWQKDYFTSAFETPQKGPAVDLPIDVNYKFPAVAIDGSGLPIIPATASNVFVSNLTGELNVSSVGTTTIDNLESATTTIENLRISARLQEWLERAMRGGTRYKEAIKSFFGVDIGDARLDRPEYIGGGSQPITISEVLQTTQSQGVGETPQGTMTGHGIAVGSQNTFKYQCKEHGWIMGIMSVLPKTAYQQGLPREFTRTDRFDYYFHEFANLGEQEVKGQELMWVPGSGANDTTWGYQQRYAEYKYSADRVSGDFRDSLDFWHLGRQFTALPALANDFIKCTPEDVERIFAVQDGTDNLWIQVYNDIKARRPMPYFANPTL